MSTPADPPGIDTRAIDLGLVTRAQADECRALQAHFNELGVTTTLTDVFVRKGYLSGAQAAALEAELELPAADAIPGYEILGKLGEGGMGVVYRARQLSMDRIVAIKVLPRRAAGSEESRARLLREARAVARLSHPNVVAGIDAGDAQGLLYFVMEFLDGESAQQALARRGPLPWREAVAIVRQVALALAHAHAHGIVHRDIKPANLMLLRDGTCKLADLGLARLDAGGDVTLTQSGMVVGSPAYLSPEQATGERAVDIRSDLYSLGLTFYELLTGARAHGGATPVAVLGSVLGHDLSVEGLPAAGVPAPVAAVVGDMTRRDPDRRYPTPMALVADLDAVLAGRLPRGARAAQARAEAATPRGWLGQSPALRLALLGVPAVAIVVAATMLAPDPGAAPAPSSVGAGVAAATPAAGAPPASASTHARAVDAPIPDEFSAPAVSLLDALEAARPSAPHGLPFHVELEGDAYSVDIAVGEHTVNVTVDAASGAVRGAIDDDENQAANLPMFRVPLGEVVRTAQAEVPTGAAAVEAEMLLVPGRAIAEVRFRQDQAAWIVRVDAGSGELIGVEPVAPR
jgi:serine/threonine-protein kinase